MCLRDKERLLLLEVLRHRSADHVNFFGALDRVRWGFTSAFGIGAFFGILARFSGQLSPNGEVAAIFLVVVLSTAGLISQIRVYPLLADVWIRINKLNELEFELLSENGIADERHAFALASPNVGIGLIGWMYYATVGMASCAVFCAFLTVGFGVIIDAAFVTLSDVQLRLICLVLFFGILVSSWKSVGSYLENLQGHPEILKDNET